MTRFRHTQRLASLLAGLASVLLAGSAYAQATEATVLTGSVKSEQGQPLQGANVVITELNISVGTNDKVQVGYEFTVFRGSEYVSTIVIDTVFANYASGMTKAGTKKRDVQAGDEVATRL